jgi:hypothetical protein
MGEKTVNEKIEELYNDKAGFGSLKDTWTDVKNKYTDIKYAQVKEWYQKNVDYNVIQRGENSYVANAPREQYQLDIFFMNINKNDKYKIGVAAIDVFTKHATAVALTNKRPETLLEALKRVLDMLGGKPHILMSDEEGSLQSKLVMDYLRKEGIIYVINRNHTPYVERFIRTFRNLIGRRLQKRPTEHWYDLLFEVLLIYNRKMVNRITGLTPNDAEKTENQIYAKLNMESHAKHEKDHKEIKVGDRVKIFRKRKRVGEKEQVLKYSRNAFEVLRIDKDPVAGNLYYLAGLGGKPFLRSQILKV